MHYLKYSELQNIVTYDTAHFPLDRNGLSIVYGRNLDASNEIEKSNGAGKSLLFTMLAETLVDQNPLIEGKHTVKDAFYRPDAMSAVGFDNFRLEKKLVGKTLKYDMFKVDDDGELIPTKVRTNEYVWQKMAKLFPITNDEFFSLYYIDSSRQSVLQRGSHGDRLKLLSKLFNLDTYDVVLAEIKERLKSLRKNDILLKEVLDQIALHEKDIDDDIDEDVRKLEDMQGKQRKLSKKRQQAQALLNQATIFHAHNPAMEYLTKQVKDGLVEYLDELDLYDPEIMEQFISQLKSGLRAQKARLDMIRDAEKAKVKLEDALDRVNSLKKRVGKWTLEQVVEDIKVAKERDAYVAKREARGAEIQAEIDRYSKKVVKPEDADDTVVYLRKHHSNQEPNEVRKALNDLVSDCRSEARRALLDRGAFDKAFKTNNCTCPTCHSELSKTAIKSIRQTLDQSIEDCDANLAKAEADQTQVERFLEYLRVKNYLKELDTELEELNLQAMNQEAFDDTPPLEHLRTIKEQITQLADEQDNLDHLQGAVDKVGGSDTSVDELQDHINRFRTCLDKAQSVEPYLKALKDATDSEAGDYDVQQLQEGLDEVDTRLSTLMLSVPKLAQSVSVARAAMEKLVELNDRRDQLSADLEDMPVLKALEEAYGQKGLKNIMIRRACEGIESNLNLNAHLLLGEPTKFKIEVDETTVHILATRELNGEQVTCDVRRFSGAEGRSFNLLVPLAVLPLLPSDRRLNILALDEPTANMDEPAINLFTEKYLPQLLKLVPHVIVLSPTHLPIDVNDAEVWTVTREDGVSTLEKTS